MAGKCSALARRVPNMAWSEPTLARNAPNMAWNAPNMASKEPTLAWKARNMAWKVSNIARTTQENAKTAIAAKREGNSRTGDICDRQLLSDQ